MWMCLLPRWDPPLQDEQQCCNDVVLSSSCWGWNGTQDARKRVRERVPGPSDNYTHIPELSKSSRSTNKESAIE
jgi:hypothetical protein